MPRWPLAVNGRLHVLFVYLFAHAAIAARRQAGAGVDAPEGGDSAEALPVSCLRRVRESMLPELRRGRRSVSANISGSACYRCQNVVNSVCWIDSSQVVLLRKTSQTPLNAGLDLPCSLSTHAHDMESHKAAWLVHSCSEV